MLSDTQQSNFDIGFSDLVIWEKSNKINLFCGQKENKKLVNQAKKSSQDLEMIPLNSRKLKNSLLSENFKSPKLLNLRSLVQEEQIERRIGKAILKNISGEIKSSEMTAIIGPSGSGKSTLLNFISSRSNWESNLFIDGKLVLNNIIVKNLSTYKHVLGYVPQEDILLEKISIRQNLEFYAQMRVIKNYHGKAQEIIDLLDLQKCADTVIGTTRKGGISSGERKRTSIGIELVSDPRVLFLDEPTTGIDAFTALKVVKSLKEINQKKGLGVVAVLHQPRREIIELFDKVSTRSYIYSNSFKNLYNSKKDGI